MARYGYKRGKATFVNPYNFVHIDRTKKHKTADSTETVEKLSGVLHCSFETKTPLAIPDIELGEVDSTGHTSYPFYRINNVPSVPGSSIRGMLRSVYETLTDSCFVTLREDTSVTARVTPKNVFKSGVLIYEGEGTNGHWNLYNATRYKLPIGAKFKVEENEIEGRYIKNNSGEIYKTGESVKVDIDEKTNTITNICKDKDSSWYMYIGEPFGKKHNESVFKKGELLKNNADKLLNGLSNTVKIYQNSKINRNLGKNMNTGYKNFESAKKRGVICVWYKKSEINDDFYVSMAAIGRKAYNKTVNDMIGEHRNPCVVIEPDKKDDNNKEENKYKNLCPACRLFGMANGGGYGSKIRITDATVKDGDENKMLGFKTLKELGSPRIGYYPFYTSDGEEYDKPGVTIAGRKFYWHIPRAKDDARVYEASEKTERNATMELMGANAKFKFDVYYDNVSKEQLNEIKWVLALPDKTQKLMHKLGHGKPLGLGSIKIIIDADERREFDGENYTVKKESIDVDSMPSIIQEDAWKQIAILCNYNAMKNCDVRYPYIDIEQVEDKVNQKKNDFAAHQWFSSNKGRGKYDPKPMTLAKVTEKEALNLKVYVPYQLDDNSRNRGQRSGGKGKGYRNSKRGY